MYYFLKLCSVAVILLGVFSFSIQETEWHEYLQNDQVKIEFSAKPCDNPNAGTTNKYVFLRISNKTSDEVEVTFSKELWYNDVCSNCNGGEESKTRVILKANETVEGTCESEFKNLKIFQSMSTGSKKTLSKFELKNLTVTKLK